MLGAAEPAGFSVEGLEEALQGRACVCVCLVAVGTTRSESQVRCSSSAGLGFRQALAAAEDLCHCKGTRKFVTNQPGLSFSSLVIVLNEG